LMAGRCVLCGRKNVSNKVRVGDREYYVCPRHIRGLSADEIEALVKFATEGLTTQEAVTILYRVFEEVREVRKEVSELRRRLHMLLTREDFLTEVFALKTVYGDLIGWHVLEDVCEVWLTRSVDRETFRKIHVRLTSKGFRYDPEKRRWKLHLVGKLARMRIAAPLIEDEVEEARRFVEEHSGDLEWVEAESEIRVRPRRPLGEKLKGYDDVLSSLGFYWDFDLKAWVRGR